MKQLVASGFLIVGLMLTGAGLAFGFTPVSVAPGTSCGSAFHAADVTTDGLTDVGEQSCAVARSTHTPSAVALLVAAGIALIGALTLVMQSPADMGEPAREAAASDGYVPGEPPTLYGSKS